MNAKTGLMAGIAGMGAGMIITGLGMLAEINHQQAAISSLERRVESVENLAFSQASGGSTQYAILGEVNADALKALLDDYESRISREFDSLTARTGIERKPLTAASSVHDYTGLVTGTSVKGPVRIFFRSWEELGGAGKPPVTPPRPEQVAGAAYGGKPYLADNGINIVRNVSDIIRLDSTMKPTTFELGTTYIAPKQEIEK